MKPQTTKRVAGLAIVAALATSACELEVNVSGDLGAADTRPRIQGSGRVVEQARPIDAFTSVALYTEGQITMIPGASEALTVEADDNLMEYLETSVSDGVLEIRVRQDAEVNLKPTEAPEFNVTFVTLAAVNLLGVGRIEISDLTTDELDLTVGGAGDIIIRNLEATELDVALNGVGSVVLAGRVDRERLTLSGTGSIDASALSAHQAIARLNGIGEIRLWAVDGLDATIAGIGDIVYSGSPSVTQRVPGSGEIKHETP